MSNKNIGKAKRIRCRVAVGKSPKTDFDTWFNFWLEEYKRFRIKIGTYETYKQYYKSLISPRLGKIPIGKISCDNIQHLYNTLYEKGYSASSIKIVGVLITGSLERAVLNGVLKQNPAKCATLPRQSTENVRCALTKEEQQLFCEYSRKSPLCSFFAFMLRTGLRSGELRGLKFCDIDRDKKVLHVNRTLKYLDGRGYFEDTPKTHSSLREIPLTTELFALLPAESRSEYIFCGRGNRPLSRDRVQSEMNRIVEEIRLAGHPFPKITPHVLRHTFATRAIEAGMSPNVLKTILGHSSLSMTMDLYSHVMPETRLSEMEKISAAF